MEYSLFNTTEQMPYQLSGWHLSNDFWCGEISVRKFPTFYLEGGIFFESLQAMQYGSLLASLQLSSCNASSRMEKWYSLNSGTGSTIEDN
jgi:hypothetical protein